MLEETLSKPTIGFSRGPKLNKIPIPLFSGNFLSSNGFTSGTFSMVHFSRDRPMIHDCPDIGKVEKRLYLLAALKGQAAILVSKLFISEDSYDLALDIGIKTCVNSWILDQMLVRWIAYWSTNQEWNTTVMKLIDKVFITRYAGSALHRHLVKGLFHFICAYRSVTKSLRSWSWSLIISPQSYPTSHCLLP